MSIPLLVDIEAAASDADDSGFIVDFDEVIFEPSGVNLPGEFIRREYGVSPERVFYILARGTSMMPTIFPGQRLLCAMLPAGLPVRDDLIYVFRSPGGILLKRLYITPDHIQVWSDNSDAPRYEVPLARWEEEYTPLAVALEVSQRL